MCHSGAWKSQKKKKNSFVSPCGFPDVGFFEFHGKGPHGEDAP